MTTAVGVTPSPCRRQLSEYQDVTPDPLHHEADQEDSDACGWAKFDMPIVPSASAPVPEEDPPAPVPEQEPPAPVPEQEPPAERNTAFLLPHTKQEREQAAPEDHASRLDALAHLGLDESNSQDEVARMVRKMSHKARKEAAKFAAIADVAAVLECEHALAKRPKLMLANEQAEWSQLDTLDPSSRTTRVKLGEPGATPKTIREFHGTPPEPFSLDGLAQRPGLHHLCSSTQSSPN